MKSISQYILLLVVAINISAIQPAIAHSDSTHRHILILNSYNHNVFWSNELANKIRARLSAMYPNISINIGNLNADILPSTGTLDLRMRSISWTVEEQNNNNIKPDDMKGNSIFPENSRPDIMVLIGEESLLYMQRHQNHNWQDTPIVVCGVQDSIISDMWLPDIPVNFTKMQHISGKRMLNYSSYTIAKNAQGNPTKDTTFTKTSRIQNITGVYNPLYIRENLELIKKLVPDLKEIIWIDDDYYKTNNVFRKVKQEVADLFPGVRLFPVRHNRINTDSLYNSMMENVPGRIYLTYSFSINGIYSSRQEKVIDSMFSNVSTSPLFSLAPQSIDNNYWVGGYYYSVDEYADISTNLITRILNGEKANDIPFELVKGSVVELNKTAIVRYGMRNRAASLVNVQYVNIPPSFYARNEKAILWSIVITIVFGGLLFYWWRYLRFCRKMKTASVQYKMLYEELKTIYNHASIYMRIYDISGCYESNISDVQGTALCDKLLSNNLFDSNYLSEDQKKIISEQKKLTTEVKIEADTYRIFIQPIKIDDTQPIRFIATIIDITPIIKELEGKEQYNNLLHFVSDISDIGVAFYNWDDTTVTATQTWCKNMNCDPDTTQETLFYKVVAEDRKKLTEYLAKAQFLNNESHWAGDIRVNGEGGTMHWIRIYIFVNTISTYDSVILNINIDDQKQSETNLIEATRLAEISDKEIGDFISHISHEIRTPLNSVVGFSNILTSEEDGTEVYIDTMQSNMRLINEILDCAVSLSALDSGQVIMSHETISITELFERLKQKATTCEVREKQLVINTDIDNENATIISDPEYLNKVLSHLITNAIKFTTQGIITIGYRKEENCHYLYVADTGCGIADQDIERIFNRFEKINLYHQGTGLGLSLCKTITDKLGGSIGVTSEIGKGSTFWVRLPALHHSQAN